jgi:hypothetical protein
VPPQNLKLKAMKVHLIKSYTNSKGINRVLVCFKRETNSFLGLKTSHQFGTMVLDEGITEEQAREAIDTDADYSDQIEFIPQLDENGVQTDFFRARPKA